MLTEKEKGKTITCVLTATDTYGSRAEYTTAVVDVDGFPWLILIPGMLSPNRMSTGSD